MWKCTLKVFEQLSEVSNTAPNTRILVSQDSHALSLLCQPLLLSLVLINLAEDFTGLWLHFGTLSSLPLRQCPNSFFLALVTIFCYFDIATIRPQLATVNDQLVYTTLRKQGLLLAFLSMTNSIPRCDQLHSKQDRSQGHTLPTENTHCNTSSLAFGNYSLYGPGQLLTPVFSIKL